MLTLALSLVSIAAADDIAVGTSTVVDFPANVLSRPVPPLDLTPGLYRFTNIDGAFQAANPWGGLVSGCDGAGANCSQGWMNSYRIVASADGTTNAGGGGRYSTPAIALANSTPTDVCLTASQTVELVNSDTAGGFTNNTGGLSIEIERLTDGSCDLDWPVTTANAEWGTEVLREDANARRLRPSTVRANLDALAASVVAAGCSSPATVEWAGTYGFGAFDGTTEDGATVAGTYGGGSLDGTVDLTTMGNIFGAYANRRSLVNIDDAGSAALGFYIRIQGTRGVWVGGETTCPENAGTALGPLLGN